MGSSDEEFIRRMREQHERERRAADANARRKAEAREAEARRVQRKAKAQKKGKQMASPGGKDSCMVVLVVMAGLVGGALWGAVEMASRLI